MSGVSRLVIGLREQQRSQCIGIVVGNASFTLFWSICLDTHIVNSPLTLLFDVAVLLCSKDQFMFKKFQSFVSSLVGSTLERA